MKQQRLSTQERRHKLLQKFEELSTQKKKVVVQHLAFATNTPMNTQKTVNSILSQNATPRLFTKNLQQLDSLMTSLINIGRYQQQEDDSSSSLKHVLQTTGDYRDISQATIRLLDFLGPKQMLRLPVSTKTYRSVYQKYLPLTTKSLENVSIVNTHLLKLLPKLTLLKSIHFTNNNSNQSEHHTIKRLLPTALSSLSNLEELKITCDWTETGIPFIIPELCESLPPSLIKLTMNHCGINRNNIHYLAEAVRRLPRLDYLDISDNNHIRNEGIRILCKDGLQYMQQLRTLNLHNIGIYNKGGIHIAVTVDMLPQLETLVVSGVTMTIMESIITSLSRRQTIQSITFTNIDIPQNNQHQFIMYCEKLKLLTGLKSFILNTTIDSVVSMADFMNALSHLRLLETLTLSNIHLDDDHMQLLSNTLLQLPLLRSLNLESNDGIRETGLRILCRNALDHLPQLTYLNLSLLEMNNQCVEEIIPTLSSLVKLKGLDLHDNDHVGMADVGRILHSIPHTIESLDISTMKIIYRGHVDNNALGLFCSGLYNLTNIRSLDLSLNNGISHPLVYNAIAHLSRLQTLSLASTNMASDACIYLSVNVLPHLHSLTDLDLSDNNNRIQEINAINILADALYQHTKKLRVLDVSDSIPVMDVQILSTRLSLLPFFTKLKS